MAAMPEAMAEAPTASPRIACLVPSITELLAALGLAPWLVARTGYCIHPREVLAAVPKVGGTKDVNLAKLRRLAPSHAIVNIDENRFETAQALREFVPQVIVTHPCAPEDVLSLIDQVAAPFLGIDGVATRAAALQSELREQLGAARPATRRHVLYLIWRDPWMTVARDTYVSRLLAHGGWLTLPDLHAGASGAGRYPSIEGREPWLADVQEVLLSSEPYAFSNEHVALAQALCPGARVRLVDGERLSWYGPRTAAGLRYARELAST
jgi:ABC-type Fe3+-hydroxamate transport system substrate-binding protein